MDELLSYTVGATRYFTHANHLYSIAATTNEAGAVVERYAYDAYGQQTVTNAAGTVEQATSSVSQTRGFTGYILDQETGLYHARARQYSPESGRFISRDAKMQNPGSPSGFDGYHDGMSLYSAYFVPMALDPYGEAEICCGDDGGHGLVLLTTRPSCPRGYHRIPCQPEYGPNNAEFRACVERDAEPCITKCWEERLKNIENMGEMCKNIGNWGGVRQRPPHSPAPDIPTRPSAVRPDQVAKWSLAFLFCQQLMLVVDKAYLDCLVDCRKKSRGSK